MKIPVFLSYPKPFLTKQEDFLKKTFEYLDNRGLAARTLGVTDYDMDAPLKAVRRILLESNGLITIAFRRILIINGTAKPNTDITGLTEQTINNVWLTSPWAQIEGAMAYQLGLPILIFREKGVIADGLLEKGVTGLYMPEFDVDEADKYFKTIEWSEVVGKWEGYVRSVLDKKGNPPQLY
ncbi:MAG: hypothetical protein ACJ797_09700 [Ktedonobacteraceae bacterium]